MKNTDEGITTRIPVLYFDARGHGPDDLTLGLESVDLRIPGETAMLGLRVWPAMEDDGLALGLIPTGGGFAFDRQGAEILWREIGEWLAKNPAPTADAPVTTEATTP